MKYTQNTPTNQELDKIDMNIFEDYVDEFYFPYFSQKSGQEHYRLLKWFGENVNGPIVDIGTHRGMSALALSGMKRNIITYDIIDHVKKPNPWTTYVVKNPIEDIISISKANLIVYDTSHNGKDEREFFNALSGTNFRGIIIFDDIHLNVEMENFWKDLIYPDKYDITSIGHGSGTGCICI